MHTVTFQFNVGNKVLWKNPWDKTEKITKGIVITCSYDKGMFDEVPHIEYIVSSACMNLICQEKDLSLAE
jgi:hypothetical protein